MHCKGGHGRSAAVAAAWLISQYNETPHAAQIQLSSRRHVRAGLATQADLLEFYARHLRNASAPLQSTVDSGSAMALTDAPSPH